MQQKNRTQPDDLQYKNLKLLQADNLFRFGTDAVLLANFVDAKQTDSLVEFCAGTGVVSLLVAARTGANIKAIEIQPAAVELAKKNIALNQMQNQIQVIQGDIKHAQALCGGRVSAIMVNPPYEKLGAGMPAMEEAIRIARSEVLCKLEDIAKSAAGLLGTGGRLYLVHKAERLAELLFCLKAHRLEPKVLRLVAGAPEKEPGLVLLKCKKDANEGLRILPMLFLTDGKGNETEELKAIYHRT